MKVHRPTPADVRRLGEWLEDLTDARQRRRAEALILYAAGLDAVTIADALSVHPNTIYTGVQAFEHDGLSAVRQLQRGGAPPRITPAQVAEIVRLAEQSPATVGLPYGRWSLRKLQGYLVKHRIVKRIGHERLRQLLKKRGSCQFTGQCCH
jgi:transposase